MLHFVVWCSFQRKQWTASFPSEILPQITVHINEPPTQIKYFWINYRLPAWIIGFNLFASPCISSSCLLSSPLISVPTSSLSHFPSPRAFATVTLIEKKLFFVIRSERAVSEKRVHRQPPRPLGSSHTLFNCCFWSLRFFLAGRRLVKSSWQQSIQSLPSSVVSNVPSALLSFGRASLSSRLHSSFFQPLFLVEPSGLWKESPLFLRLLSIGERQEMSLLCRIN